MTLTQLRSLVSYWVDDLNQTYFTPAQLNFFLNRALKEVHKYIVGAGQDYYIKCVQTSLVVNQRDYVLPEDFEKLNRLEVVNSGTVPNENVTPIVMITPNQKDFVYANTGTPNVYYFKKNRIVLLPAAQTALTIRMLYTYMVADMVNDFDVPDCPEQYHEFIAILAAIDCFIKDARDASLLVAKKEEYINRMKADVDQRNVDRSRMVLESGQYADFDYEAY